MAYFAPPTASEVIAISPDHPSWPSYQGNFSTDPADAQELTFHKTHSANQSVTSDMHTTSQPMQFSAEPALLGDVAFDPIFMQTEYAPSGVTTSAPAATVYETPTLPTATGTVASPAMSQATLNFSDRAFWTLRTRLPITGNESVEDTYEQLYLRYPQLHLIICSDFGNWCLRQPAANSTATLLPIKTSGEGHKLDKNEQLPEPVLDQIIELEGGKLLTAFSVHGLYASQPSPLRDDAEGADASIFRQPNRNRPQTVHPPLIPEDTVGPSVKTEATDSEHSKTVGPDSGSDLQNCAFPDASLCEKFTVEGNDDWVTEEAKTSELSQRFFSALTSDFDRNMAAPPLNIDEKAHYVEKQEKASVELQKYLSTNLGHAAAKLNCDKLAKTIILVHKIGAPKQASARAKLAKMICSERSNAVETAIKAHKRIAIDVAEGRNLQKLACNAQQIKYDKIMFMKSNFIRDKNHKALQADRQAKEAAGAAANSAVSLPKKQAATPAGDGSGNEQQAPRHKRKIGQAAAIDEDVLDDKQPHVKKAKVD
ncbi:hypothetical protein LTR36_005477 [Oleoguttula mirabilis]|uniref:Uncharacterized protein n=1 Tax=Oleoguttula mirabilis TaxID=1507867 RepID=A0AAV9JEP3_9PEZI|nr:hypothetical protein LTR36_005477 [Oleoguttula mirabilis]